MMRTRTNLEKTVGRALEGVPAAALALALLLGDAEVSYAVDTRQCGGFCRDCAKIVFLCEFPRSHRSRFGDQTDRMTAQRT